MSERVSIIIPTYNGEAYLRESLGSVFGQTQLPSEIIVVDDCSRDGTVALAEEISRSASVGMRILRSETNSGGPGVPINRGIAESIGEVICVLDQDDVLLPETLAWHARALESVREASFSFTLGGFLNRSEETLQSDGLREELRSAGTERGGNILIDGERALRLFALHGNYVRGFPGFAFRRSAWTAVGEVRTNWRIGSDLDFLCSLTRCGPAVFVPEVGYLRREHEGNLCNDWMQMGQEIVQILSSHILRAGELRSDESVSRGIGRLSVTAARRLRDSGEYRQALEMCAVAMRMRGSRIRGLREATKVVGHGVTRRLGMLETVRRMRSAW